jgi:spore maturation protein CgeB
MGHRTDPTPGIPVNGNLAGVRVLVLAPVGGYGGFNTSVHRVRAMQSLGMELQVVDCADDARSGLSGLDARARAWLFRQGLPVRLPDPGGNNERLLAASARDWDMVWLEKALTVGATQMLALRSACPRAMLVGFSPDDMHARHNQSLQFLEALSLYDAFLTTKSYNVEELRQAGCPRVLFAGNGYDPQAFRPVPASSADRTRLGGDVGFIGSYERERAETMAKLAAQGIKVRVWGNGWEQARVAHPNLTLEGRPLHGDDFAIACNAFKINLGFLRKLNRDQQTTRSVEVPACGGFMLAERTPEHLDLFIEGQEAEFFSSVEELAAKCRTYLADDVGRETIAKRGHQRCLTSGYSNASRLLAALTRLGLGAPGSRDPFPQRPAHRAQESDG